MNLFPASLSEMVLYSTVRFSFKQKNTGRPGFATGFFFNYTPTANYGTPALVTNRHVVADDIEDLEIVLHEAGIEYEMRVPTGKKIKVGLDTVRDCWVFHPDKNVDLCCLPFLPIMQQVEELKHSTYLSWLDKSLILSDFDLMNELTAASDVLMFGYPIGLSDETNNFPLIRKGITSSHPCLDFNGDSIGALDIACFPGSSGSPVILPRDGLCYSKKTGKYEIGGGEPIFLGVLSSGATMSPTGLINVQSIPVQNQIDLSNQMIVMHMGFYVKAKEVLRLLDSLREKYYIDPPEEFEAE